MYRVMIVDDEELARNLLVKKIRSVLPEIEVMAVASDGKEALEAALLLKPEIVITDISMPFMNGLELIREMQQAGIQSRTVVVSGYDEFDYAKQAISLGVKDYLLKPFVLQELRDVLSKIVQELDSQKALQQNLKMLQEQAVNREELARERAVRGLLEGRYSEENDLRKLNIDLEGKSCVAGALRLTGGNWNFKRQENIEKFLMLIKDGYFASDIDVFAVSFDGSMLAAVWCGKERTEEAFLRSIRSGLTKVQASLDKYYQIQMACALGRPCTQAVDLSRSYEEALTAWKRNVDEPDVITVYGEQERKTKETSDEQIQEHKDQIRYAVRTGQIREALGQLQELIKCYAALGNRKNDYISLSVAELVYAVSADMEPYKIAEAQNDPPDNLSDRIRYSSLMDIKEMLENYLKECCRIVAENSEEKKADAVVKQVRMLVDSNLKNTEMDVEWIAARVHFSASYVRRIFREQTGESLGDYIIQKRMEKAGILLQKTDLRIQEIAEECGYDNQRYFASSFKKFYRCTPTEFKKAVGKERLY